MDQFHPPYLHHSRWTGLDQLCSISASFPVLNSDDCFKQKHASCGRTHLLNWDLGTCFCSFSLFVKERFAVCTSLDVQHLPFSRKLWQELTFAVFAGLWSSMNLKICENFPAVDITIRQLPVCKNYNSWKSIYMKTVKVTTHETFWLYSTLLETECIVQMKHCNMCGCRGTYARCYFELFVHLRSRCREKPGTAEGLLRDRKIYYATH